MFFFFKHKTAYEMRISDGSSDVCSSDLAFFVALQLPNVFRRLFAEGAFNAAFVPLYVGARREEGRDGARVFARHVFAVILLVLSVLTVLVEIFMPAVMGVVAGGFADDPAKFALAVSFARLTFPYLLFVSLAAMFGGILNTLERFVAAAAAPILHNLVLIGPLAWLDLGTLRTETRGTGNE